MQPSNNQSYVSAAAVIAVVQTIGSTSTSTNALNQLVSTVTYETPKPCILNVISPATSGATTVSVTVWDANVTLGFNTTATSATNSSLLAPGGTTLSRILWAGTIVNGPPVLLGLSYTNGLVVSPSSPVVVGFYQNSAPFK